MIKVKIDVTKLDKTAFFKGAKGTYVDLVLWECKGGRDQYGNEFLVKQDMPKDRRAEKVPIIGSAKYAGTAQPQRQEPEPEVYTDMKPQAAPATARTAPQEDADVPY